MSYKCNLCDYSTDFSSNFNRHNRSISHKKRTDKQTEKDSIIVGCFKCPHCNRSFSKQANLQRHINSCIKLSQKLTDMKSHYEGQLDELKDELKESKIEAKFLKDKLDILNNYQELLGQENEYHKMLVNNIVQTRE